MLKQLRARNPQANNDLEALIYDYRAAQAQDRRDIKRLDNENDNEEELIARLERDLAKLKSMRGVEEGLRSGEWHDVHVTFDDGSKATVKTTGDSGYRDQITQHFARQGKTVKDIEIDWSVKSEARDRSPGKITKSEDPCWSGYHMVGTKNKGGREVPNCVPGKKGA